MQYLERTAQLRAALLQRTDLIDHIRDIFCKHISGNRKGLPWCGEGTLRRVYAIGKCDTPSGTLNLLLKVRNDIDTMSNFDSVAGRIKDNEDLQTGEREELGAFDAYYSFAAGLTDKFGFVDEMARSCFLKEIKRRTGWAEFSILNSVPQTFRLDDDEWPGTSLRVGDLGALPYAQMVLNCNGIYGCLVEGLPPLVKSLNSADMGHDEGTVERGRIIDLGSAHCLLSKLNGRINRETFKHPDYLGLIARGTKYFAPDYRIDL